MVLPEMNSFKFHNNDVPSTWTKDQRQQKQPTEVFLNKGVLQIRSKLCTQGSYILLQLHSVKYAKITEDLENINVEENKHES